MARLNKQKAATVAAAESSFDVVPEGWYHARLRAVDATRSGAKGPYWVWEYEIVGSDDGKHLKRRLWNNTSLSDAAAGIFKQTFDAFGAETDADTDDLCGQVVKVLVGHRTIQSGAREGQLGEQISRLAPKDDDFVLPDELAGASAGEASEDIFE